MKLLNKIISVLLLVCLVGCKSIPSEATMEVTSYAVGMAASYVINKSNIDEDHILGKKTNLSKNLNNILLNKL